ncbi:MAG: hypothetical protein IH991_02015 [Planctomycetes bacterium]|nr:hypothetical protein [Planctomycetota bacterium]
MVLEDTGSQPINTRRWEAWREGIEDYLYILGRTSGIRKNHPVYGTR